MTSFNNVSESVRASKNFIELAGVQRSLASLFIPPTGALVGMYDPTKTATVNYLPVKVVSADDVGNKFGFGSHIHRQALKFPSAVFLQGGGVYAFPIPEESGGTAADETITFVGTSSSSGTWYFSIGGDLISFPVSSGDDVTAQALALVTAITAKQNIAVTAAAVAGVVTVTAKFKGTQGNQILIKTNPSGEAQENNNPGTTAVTLENADGYLDGGATDPDLEDMFFDSSGNDILGDRWYTSMTMPFVDSTTIGYYKDSANLRALPVTNRMYGSHPAYVESTTYTQALAIPATINSKFIGPIWDERAEYPAFELSAELVGIILDEQNKAPNRPYKTIALDGPVDTDTSDKRYEENDALFRAGMGFCKVDNSGTFRLGDIALSYRTNDVGGETEEWFDAVTLYTRMAKAYSLEQLFLSEKYQRAVVVDNNAVTKVEYAIAPKDVIADITKLINDLWLPYGWSKNGDAIIESISAEINSGNNGRIDAELLDDEAKALRIIALKYAYLY